MMKVKLFVIFGALLILMLAGTARASTTAAGHVSAYEKAPTDATYRYRVSIGDLEPGDLYRYDALVATRDCGLIGREGLLFPIDSPRPMRVKVFDCAGDDGGYEWMGREQIVVEIDWYAWQRRPEIVYGWAALAIFSAPYEREAPIRWR